MPYKNLPKRLWGKMERCVARLKKEGKIDNPYAVCFNAIKGGSRRAIKKKNKK